MSIVSTSHVHAQEGSCGDGFCDFGEDASTCPSDCLEKVPCPGDFNDDRIVNGNDIAVLLSQWGGAGDADLDGDDIISGSDLTIILASWGECPKSP